MSTAETKTVTLAGKSFDVPPVTFRNCAKIYPLVDKAFAAVRANTLDEATYLNLGRIVYYGTNGAGGLTEEEFFDLIIPTHEMSDAALVVAQQAGLVAIAPGEATGT